MTSQRLSMRSPRRARRAAAIALATAATLTLAACGSSSKGPGASSGGAKAGSHGTIAFVQELNDPFFQAAFRGAQQEAAKLGYKVYLTGPGQLDTAQQISDVQSAVARNVSGIALSPIDATALVPAAQQAKTAHIPLMVYATPLARSSLAVATALAVPTQGAVAGGRLMCKLIGNHGHVLLLEAALGNPNTTERWTGFKQGMRASCPNVTIVSELTGNSQTKAASFVSSALTRYPDLKGVFADDIVNADGAVTGLKSAGALGKVKVGAFDAEPSEVQDLKAGTIQFLVAQKPLEEGELAIHDLWLHAHGKTPPSFTNVGTVLMTKANLSKTGRWAY